MRPGKGRAPGRHRAPPWMGRLQSPLPTHGGGLSSPEGPPHPFSKSLPNPSHPKTGVSLHCLSSSLGPAPSTPHFPGLGWEEIQPLWDDITHPPACRVVSHLDTCSQLTPTRAALGRQHPERQMPERARRWEPAGAGGGEGSQEHGSVCVSICPPPSLWSSPPKKCHRLSCVLCDVWRTFPYPLYLCPRVSVLRKLPPVFQGAGGGGMQIFSPLRNLVSGFLGFN